MIIGMRTGKFLGPEVNYAFWKKKFQVHFIVFIDHKSHVVS